MFSNLLSFVFNYILKQKLNFITLMAACCKVLSEGPEQLVKFQAGA